MDGFKNGMEAKMDGVEAKMDGLKKGVEANMDGLKNGMEDNMDCIEDNLEYFKKDMEGFKEGLAKLLQEKLPNGEKVVDETHDENKINVNHYLIDSSVGFKTHHIPNIDMRKFYGKDLVMEQYFDLHNVKNTQKVHIATLYLKQNTFVWYYRWIFSRKKIVTW